MLTALANLDTESKLARQRLSDYFYHKEHLFIVTNLLNESLASFCKVLAVTNPFSGELRRLIWICVRCPARCHAVQHTARSLPLSAPPRLTTAYPRLTHGSLRLL